VLLERNEAFQAAIPDSWLEQSSHVVGYDTSSWLLAPRCAAIGTPFLLEQTIAHSRAKERVFAEVRSRYPEWAEDVRPKAERILELEEREHRAASVVTAPCTFVKATLVEHGVDAEKIEVLPLGVDCAQFRPSSRPGDGKRPIRFLFLGHVTARKGIPCLLEAWSRMGASGAELWIAGNVSEAVRPLLPQMKGLRILGRLPEEQLAQTYRQCDVFVFPSFFEGFGLVLLEAMACGLPLISTEATAAPDLVKEGREGFVIPAGDSASLADRMSRFLDAPGLSQEMGAAARSRAAQFTWESYGLHWLRTMESIGRGSETSAALPAVAHPPRVP
jgi:glycosyltransferase involved in cell wall biosynthesis